MLLEIFTSIDALNKKPNLREPWGEDEGNARNVRALYIYEHIQGKTVTPIYRGNSGRLNNLPQITVSKGQS